jgi:phage I-like protein
VAPKGKYAVQHQPSKAPDKRKPWCVINLDTGDINGRWHATEEDANKQLKAMYANMGDKAYMNSEAHQLSYLMPIKQFSETWIDGGTTRWIKLYPYDSWDHPFFGETTINEDVARQFVENFNKGVKGQELHSDYEHGFDPAKGNKASGKFLKVEARPDGPYALVQFTEQAKKEIDDGEWNYWSTSHYDTWTHPHTQETYDYVLDGGGLTNKPYVKGMVPLNFSELILDNPELKVHAVLSSSERDNLPDSAFLYIEPDGKKDAEGKTVPRSKRHLPFKNIKGQIDHAHLVNAKSRLSQNSTGAVNKESWLSDSLRKTLLARVNNSLKQHTETLLDYGLMNNDEINALFSDEEVVVESPEIVPDSPVNDETDEEGMNELLKRFSELLGLSDVPEDKLEETVFNTVSEMHTEIEPLRELKKDRQEAKQFSELYPEQAEELRRLRTRDQEAEAKQFSENLLKKRVTRKTGEGDDVKDEPTGLGFSSLVAEKAGEVVKKFSEGAVTVEDFKQFAESVLDNGIVDYGTHGSSRENETEPTQEIKNTDAPQNVRKVFSERIQKLADDEFEGDFLKAYAEAADRWPKDFENYKRNKPVMAAAS